MDIPMNKEQYANFWKPESEDFNSNNTYETLSKLIPSGKVLEIGCGVGLGTYYLSQNHEVLSLDNNQFLISQAKSHLDAEASKYQIHQCELFELTDDDKNLIHQFKPNIIVGWFLGADGETVNKYTQEEQTINNKGKLYREKLEDIIVSNDLLIDSVETINLVMRVGRLKNATKKDIYIAQKEDYDTHVFKKVGFEVVSVEVIDWNMTNSNFRYSSNENSHISKNDVIPTIISITARRRK